MECFGWLDCGAMAGLAGPRWTPMNPGHTFLESAPGTAESEIAWWRTLDPRTMAVADGSPGYTG